MTFNKITDNVENISLLPDDPALTPEQLKKEFDKGNRTIKEAFNKLIDELNKINDNALEKKIITAYPTKTQSMQGYQSVILDASSQIGQGFSLESGKIKVGPNIKKVLIGGAIFFEAFPVNEGYLFPAINKNGTAILHALGIRTGSEYLSLAFPTQLRDVKEGDIIELNTGDVQGASCKVRLGQDSTYITIEAVE